MHLRLLYDLNNLSVLGSRTLWSLNPRFIDGLNADQRFVVQGVLPFVYKQNSETVKMGNSGRADLHQQTDTDSIARQHNNIHSLCHQRAPASSDNFNNTS